MASSSPMPASAKIIKMDDSSTVLSRIFPQATYDCHFCIGDQRIGGHRQLLAANSSVFATMFSSTWSDSFEIIITDTTYDAFKAFVTCLYNGQITITSKNIAELLYLAHKYDVAKLLEGCCQYLRDSFTSENAVESLRLAMHYQLERLAADFVKRTRDDLEAVLQSSRFQHCDAATLHAILNTDDELGCDAEDVFDACIRWAEQKCTADELDPTSAKNVRAALGTCFDLINFEEMDGREFAKRYRVWKALFTREEAEAAMLHFCERPSKRAKLVVNVKRDPIKRR